MKTLLLASCIIAFAAALPAEDVVVPEQALFEAVDADFEATRTELEQLRAKKTSDKDCRELADATENNVKASVKAQQDALDSIDKGEKCPTEHAKEVHSSKKILDKAKADKKKADDVYAKAKKTKINFGDYTYDQLTPGQCTTFFSQPVYKKAHTAVKQAEKKAEIAKGSLTTAQKAYDAAVDDQKKAINKCHCDVKKLQKATLDKMNSDVKAANEKLYKKAANLRCLLDGTPASKCKVGSIPVVVPVKVTAATAAVKRCAPTGLAIFSSFKRGAKKCGSKNGCVINTGSDTWGNTALGTQWMTKEDMSTKALGGNSLGYGFCVTRGPKHSNKASQMAMIGFATRSQGAMFPNIEYSLGAIMGNGGRNYLRVYNENKKKYELLSGWPVGTQACMWMYKMQVRVWAEPWGSTQSDDPDPRKKKGWTMVWASNPAVTGSIADDYRLSATMYSNLAQFSDIYWISKEPTKGMKGKPPMA